MFLRGAEKMASISKSLNIGNLDFSEDSFALDVVSGLSTFPKHISPKYLYDERGSRLFQEIMQLREYYPTQCEVEIMQHYGDKISAKVGKGTLRILELGSGDGEKTRILIRQLLKNNNVEYIPIDISKDMIAEIVHEFEEEFHTDSLTVTGIASDYISALRWLHHQPEMRTLILFLGSSIGNFEEEKLFPFLLEIWNALSKGDWALIGFDLKKDISVLEAAYNDSKGVTKEFNLNLIDRINRELDGNFRRELFVHHVFYNPAFGRMESWLVSTAVQKIELKKLKKKFLLDAWEGIHLESSYKYTVEQIQNYAEKSGFKTTALYTDVDGYFLEALWQKN